MLLAKQKQKLCISKNDSLANGTPQPRGFLFGLYLICGPEKRKFMNMKNLQKVGCSVVQNTYVIFGTNPGFK